MISIGSLGVRAVPLSREAGMRTGEMRSYATDEKTEVMAHCAISFVIKFIRTWLHICFVWLVSLLAVE